MGEKRSSFTGKIGYVIGPDSLIGEMESEGKKYKRKKMFVVMIKYIAPVFIVLILISSILDVLGIVKI